MQEEEKLVDIDTSGPDTEVELNQEEQSPDTTTVESTETSSTEPVEPASEDKTYENERETKLDKAEDQEEKKEEKDKELENYSKDVQRRIAKLTKKWREAERQKEEAAEFAKAQIKLREEAEAKISKLEPGYLQSTEDSITSGIQAAQAKLAETKVAQEEYKKQKEAQPKPEVNLNRQPASQGSPDPKAEQWAAKNSWFGQDTAMTYTAFDLHKKLTEDEGYDPQSDEYYSEIDKRIRLEFPNKFGNNTDTGENTAKPVQQVASAKRSTNTGRKNTVRLTSSQVAIAKKLGVPLEEYAKQLKITKEV